MAEVATAIEPTTEPVVEALEPIAPENQSLADHEAQFGKSPTVPRDDTTGRFTKADSAKPAAQPERHRAQSQQAAPADTPRIAELTKKWRDAERERDNYRAEIEKLRTNGQQTSAPAEPSSVPSSNAGIAQPAMSSQNGQFSKPEPTINDFIGRVDDPYLALSRALANYDREKWQWEQEQRANVGRAEQTAQQEFTRIKGSYDDRRKEFEKTHKDFNDVVNAAPAVTLTPLLQAAILTDDNGPEFVYSLAQHPDWQYEMLLLTEGKYVSEESVASVQRLLKSRVANASTGSFPAQAPVTPAPRPLNPVRTGPIRTADEPPGDSGSLADHERWYGKKRGR
jgi:hypothetical protein